MKSTASIIAIAIATLLAAPAHAKKEPDQLPPGLQKKVQRGKPLPPGWQRKRAVGEVLEQQIYDAGQIVVPIDDKGLVTLRVEGRLIRLFEATREVVEILK